MNQSILNLVAATLSELGLPAPTNSIPTMLMKDGYFAGHKLRYDGGCAILWAANDVIEFYDEQGKLLKTVGIETPEKGAAA
jgi:hypothetical protein